METPSFVKVNEKDQLEIQLSGKSLTNQSLRSNIEELEQFLRAQGTEKRRIHLDLTDNPEVTDEDSDPGEGGFNSLVLFLRSFGSDVTRLEIGGTRISGNGLLSLLDFVKLGVAEELNFSRLPRVDESTALAVLTAVQECHAYPLNKKLPLLLRMDRIGLDDPKYILAKAFNDVDECYEVLTETPELLAAQAARLKAQSNQSEAPDTAVTVSLPYFYSQEPEDDVTTPAPPSPVTPPSKPAKPLLSLQTPEKHVEPQLEVVEIEELPVESGLPRAFLANGQARKVALPKPPSVGPPPHLLWKAAPKSEMARRSLEAQIEQSTSPKAPPPPPRPKPSSSTALATPPLPPPPPRPMASTEVRKVPSPQQTQQKPPRAFHAQEKLEPDKAEDDEKDSWSWWKGRWWDWDSQEKKYIEVEQSDKAHGWAHDPSHDWQNGSWQEHVRDWRPWSWSNEEKKACPLNSWTQNWRNKGLQDEDKPSCQQGGWNGEDWKDWKNSSDWTWNSWNSMEKWIQDERYKEKDIEREESHTDAKQKAKSSEKEPSEADSDMELDLVSDKEALSVEYKDDPIGQWANLLRKWEDEKTEKLKELASSETSCREVGNDEDDGLVRQTSDEYESIREEEEDEHEELIKRTREVLQRHRGEAPVHRSGKRGRSPLPQEPPYSPPKKFRMRRSGKASSKRGKARYAKLDDNRELSKVEVGELRYSQLSCKETFQCGRSVSHWANG